MNPESPQTNHQGIIQTDNQPSVPQQNLIQDPPVDMNDATALSLQQQHKQNRRNAFRITAAIVCIVSIIVMVLTMLGSASQDYNYVRSLSSAASMMGYFLIAGSMGIFLAYRAAHPVKMIKPGSVQQPLQLRPVNAFLVIGGFILGVIPGLIWAAVITYPLSYHACKLSGSKYC